MASQLLLGTDGGPKAVGKWFEKQRAKERKTCEDQLTELNKALRFCAGTATEAESARLRQSIAACQAKLTALQQKPKPKRKSTAGPVDFEATVREYLNGNRAGGEPAQKQKRN